MPKKNNIWKYISIIMFACGGVSHSGDLLYEKQGVDQILRSELTYFYIKINYSGNYKKQIVNLENDCNQHTKTSTPSKTYIKFFLINPDSDLSLTYCIDNKKINTVSIEKSYLPNVNCTASEKLECVKGK